MVICCCFHALLVEVVVCTGKVYRVGNDHVFIRSIGRRPVKDDEYLQFFFRICF